ncbi:4'-phosphopantetheinyl transferase [Bradyrhizobium japonicum]
MWLTARPANVAPALARGDVHLWLVELDGACDTGQLLPVLSDAERMVAAGHRADERGRRYIVAHAALRQLLQAYVHISAADLVFATGRFGKPRTVLPRFMPPIHFSLSHGGRRCLIGIARGGEVGVDIEPIDRRGDISSMAIAVLSESEHARWRALSPCARRTSLLRTWTCKEAVLKASGIGLSISPRRCEIEWPRTQVPRLASLDGQAMPEWTLEGLEPDSTLVGAWAAQAALRVTFHAVFNQALEESA